MTTTYVKFVIDPDGDNYTVPSSDLINARVIRKVNSPTTFEFKIRNPDGARNDTYAMDDKVDVYLDTSSTPTTKVATGLLTEVEIQREGRKLTWLVGRGEDYLTVLSYRLARAGFPGAVDVSTILTNLLTEFASGEFTTTNVDSTGINITDFTTGTRDSLLGIMRELSEYPTGDSYDFYLDGDNDLHFHKRSSTAHSSGVTLDEDNIRTFISRRSTRDKKTFIHIYGAHTPSEESSLTQNVVTNSVTLDAKHYADDFVAEHNNIMKIELYIQKVGTPSADFNGRIALAKNGDPTGDFKTFTIREEDVSGTAGWHSIPVDINTQVGSRYFIKLDKVGSDSSNTYKWCGDTPAVLDTVNTALSSTDALKWDAADYDFSMKIHYGEYTELSASTATTPKREGVVMLPRAISADQAQLLADRLLATHHQTHWMASVVMDAPTAELKPGDLITLDETDDGLASKTYRIEQVSWDFASMGRTETVTLDISAALPYEDHSEQFSRMNELFMSGGGSQLESGALEGAAAARIGKAVVHRSLVEYEPS